MALADHIIECFRRKPYRFIMHCMQTMELVQKIMSHRRYSLCRSNCIGVRSSMIQCITTHEPQKKFKAFIAVPQASTFSILNGVILELVPFVNKGVWRAEESWFLPIGTSGSENPTDSPNFSAKLAALQRLPCHNSISTVTAIDHNHNRHGGNPISLLQRTID